MTPNDAFFTSTPPWSTAPLNVDDWQLTGAGLVDREVRLTYEQLGLPLFEQFVTITLCLQRGQSSELIGNAAVDGIDLRRSFDMSPRSSPRGDAGGGSTAVDGFTATPTAWAMNANTGP